MDFDEIKNFDRSTITVDWIKKRMSDLGLKRNDLINDLGLTKSYISLLFAKDDNPRKIYLSKQTRAMFYYYFLVKEFLSNK